MKLSVLLSPEGETLWIRRPEILLLTDYAIMDKNDYERIQSRAGRSELDSQSAALLEAYLQEGLVTLLDYKNALPNKSRVNVYNLSKEIFGFMSFEERKLAAIHSHSTFASYLGSKLEHLNPGEPLFNRSAAARKKTLQNIEIIKALDSEKEQYPAHIGELQRRSLAKWLASEELSKRCNSNFIFDLDGYKPYALKIRECLSSQSSAFSSESLFVNDKQVPFKVMWEAIRTQLPVLNIESTDDLLRFKPMRKEFQVFREILRDLTLFYEEVPDVDVLKKYTNRKLKDAIDSVQSKMDSRPKQIQRYLPTYLSYLLKKIFIPTNEKWLQEKVKKEQSKELFNHVKNAYQKLCCFSFYATRSPIPKVTITEDDKESLEHWVTGAALSWYETDETQQSQ